jgi:hypothetical protein
MDIEAINDWFSRHDDAVLVTDKVNRPIDFAAAFVDPDRLMMELFSVEAIEQAKQAGIRSAMLTGDLLAGMSRDPIKTLNYLKVKDVALSRRVIRANLDLLDRLGNAGIRVYVFHVGQANRDEAWVVCRDMDVVYGLYADRWDFETFPGCAEQP